MFIFSRAPWYRVPPSAVLAQPWFWVGLAGFALFFLTRWLATPDPAAWAGDVLAVVGLLVGLLSWLRGPTRGQVQALDRNVTGMREEMRAGFTDLRQETRAGFKDLRQEMHGVRGEMHGMREEMRSGFAALTGLLAEIRDRLPPSPR